MLGLAFFDPDERTDYSDELYAVVGRALTVAIHYENNCQRVANHWDIIRTVGNSEKRKIVLETLDKKQLKYCIDKFISTVKAGLGNDGVPATVVAGVDEIVFGALGKAREARNVIAHELALGFCGQAEDGEFRKQIIEIVRREVHKIAIADFWLAQFIEVIINKNQDSPSLEKYVSKMVSWVCDIEY